MTLEQAIDFLAGNCPTIFKPIAEELGRLGEKSEKSDEEIKRLTKDNEQLNLEKEDFKARLQITQEGLDFLLLKGGM